ncbi:MAG: hypothetical protein ACXIUM_04020 [Wenzhouxiangella sp.]
MRCLLCSVLLLSLAAAEMAVADINTQNELFDEAEHIARLLAMTDGFLQSSEPTQQAAGLMMSWHLRWAEWAADTELLGEAEFLDHLQRLIELADTALARALLAHLCAVKDIRSDCIGLGLDAAIVRYDGAELLARLQLTKRDDSDRMRQLILAAQNLDERQMDYALFLHDAMQTHGGFVDAEFSVAPLIHGLSLSPSFSPFVETCGSPSPDEPELDQACGRIVERMVQGRGSLMIAAIGSAVSAQRRMALGDPHAQELHDQWRASISEHGLCRGGQTDEFMISADARFIRNFLAHWREHGEISAWSMVEQMAGVDCAPLQASPLRSQARDQTHAAQL